MMKTRLSPTGHIEPNVPPHILKLAKQIYFTHRADLALIVPKEYSSWGSLPPELKQSIVEVAIKDYWKFEPVASNVGTGIRNRINKRPSARRAIEPPRPFSEQRVREELQYCNRRNPSLRLQLPARASLLAAPEFEICIKFFWRYQRALVGEDGGCELASVLIELETKHPVEWEYCGWKADAIAALALGTAGRSDTVNKRKKAFDKWSSQHWNLLKHEENELNRDLSPHRQAAIEAACDLNALQFGDELIRLGMSKERTSERERMRRLIEWLKNEWKSILLPKTKINGKFGPRRLCDLQGEALLQEIERRYRGPKLPTSIVRELCEAFRDAEPREIKELTPHTVLLQLVANRHGVGSRLVAGMHAKMHDD